MAAKRPKAKEPRMPVERYDTLRHRISSLLTERTLSARELSAELRIPETDVYDHLEHIRKTTNKGDYHLVVTPAGCEKCGFVFRKRGRLKKPGKCPICRSQFIKEPFFSMKRVSDGRSAREV